MSSKEVCAVSRDDVLEDSMSPSSCMAADLKDIKMQLRNQFAIIIALKTVVEDNHAVVLKLLQGKPKKDRVSRNTKAAIKQVIMEHFITHKFVADWENGAKDVVQRVDLGNEDEEAKEQLRQLMLANNDVNTVYVYARSDASKSIRKLIANKFSLDISILEGSLYSQRTESQSAGLSKVEQALWRAEIKKVHHAIKQQQLQDKLDASAIIKDDCSIETLVDYVVGHYSDISPSDTASDRAFAWLVIKAFLEGVPLSETEATYLKMKAIYSGGSIKRNSGDMRCITAGPSTPNVPKVGLSSAKEAIKDEHDFGGEFLDTEGSDGYSDDEKASKKKFVKKVPKPQVASKKAAAAGTPKRGRPKKDPLEDNNALPELDKVTNKAKSKQEVAKKQTDTNSKPITPKKQSKKNEAVSQGESNYQATIQELQKQLADLRERVEHTNTQNDEDLATMAEEEEAAAAEEEAQVKGTLSKGKRKSDPKASDSTASTSPAAAAAKRAKQGR